MTMVLPLIPSHISKVLVEYLTLRLAMAFGEALCLLVMQIVRHSQCGKLG